MDSGRTISRLSAARLVLFAPNLHGGGAERVLARLATHWAGQGRNVTLVTLDVASPNDFSLPRSVRRLGLGLTVDSTGPVSALRNNLNRVRAVRRAFRDARPEVVISIIDQTNVLALLAARPLNVPVVVAEHTDPAAHPLSPVWQRLRRWTYRRCAALVVLTDRAADLLRPIVRGRPVVVIPNGIGPPTIEAVRRNDGEERTLVGLGRLSREKGFDRLIAAFGQVAERHPQWRLLIHGDGPARDELQTLVVERGLAGRVMLPGRTDSPEAALAAADLFALPSRYEGFPMSLLEAMAAGLPAVAFDGISGVRQILRDRIDGLLVPDGDVAAFATALGELMSDGAGRRQMGGQARAVVDRFGLDAFFARWDAVLEAAVRGDFSQVFVGHGE